jgi:CelD/BcsL family acetyltransferase involved in cellulose biosynthesis
MDGGSRGPGDAIPGVRATRIDARAIDDAGLAAWGELADRAAEPNPYFRPEFLLANVIERGLSVELLVAMDGQRWLACLPVRSRPPTLRLPLSSLTAMTDEYSFSGTPLIDRDALGPAADSLIQLVRAESRAAILLIPMFDSGGPVGRALDAAAVRHDVRLDRISSFQRAAWRRSRERHFPGPAFNHSDRRELSRTARRLSAELGGDLVVVDRTNEPAAWEQFLAMENSGWKADWGTALGSTARDAGFFRRMCAGMAAAGCFELVSLEVAGRTVAMESHLIDGPTFWPFKVAYDPVYRKFSPGTQLMYRVIDGLHERSIEMADTGAVPDNAHMNRLWPDKRTMHTVLVPTGSPAARLVPLVMLARDAARSVRNLMRRGAGSAAPG